MVWYNPKTWFINEEIKAFKNKSDRLTDKQIEKQSGEGLEDISISGYGVNGLSSFNMFYDSYINKKFKDEVSKIQSYRSMMSNPEIADVVEDAVNESLQTDTDGYALNYKISDETITKKETLVKNINNEFYDLFYNKLNIEDKLWDMLYTYYVDGRLYTENVINESNHKQGLLDLKKLPSETMDRVYDEYGRISFFVQYLKQNCKKPKTLEEARNDENMIPLYPSQVNFMAFQYGKNKETIYGYLDKCSIPYNQLKLLETSMIIYRIVRAPERFVFKIDTGAMPRDKAMNYVEKIKKKMNQKQTFDPETGTLQNNSSVLSVMDNFFLPQSETRGSDISTVGGSNIGFKDLDDIHYFQKKLFRSLKYPISRVENRFEERSGDNLFRGNTIGEITRDEIKWAKFLERQQKKFADMLRDVFLLHLQFKGLKDHYGLSKDNLQLKFTPPSDYKEQMNQAMIETRMNNYMQLANEEGMSKYFLMKQFLQWDEETIKENAEGLKKDKDLGFTTDEGRW